MSHSPSSGVDVCTQAFLIHEGRQLTIGSPEEVTQACFDLLRSESSIVREQFGGDYSLEGQDQPPRDPAAEVSSSGLDSLDNFETNAPYVRTGTGSGSIKNVLFIGNSGAHQSSFKFGEKVACSIFIALEKDLPYLNIAYRIKTLNGTPVIYGDTQLYDAYKFSFRGRCMYRVDFNFKLTLVHGSYALGASVSMPTPKFGNDRSWEQIDHIPVCRTFQVEPRSEGMVDETVVWDNKVTICELAPPT